MLATITAHERRQTLPPWSTGWSIVIVWPPCTQTVDARSDSAEILPGGATEDSQPPALPALRAVRDARTFWLRHA